MRTIAEIAEWHERHSKGVASGTGYVWGSGANRYDPAKDELLAKMREPYFPKPLPCLQCGHAHGDFDFCRTTPPEPVTIDLGAEDFFWEDDPEWIAFQSRTHAVHAAANTVLGGIGFIACCLIVALLW